MDRLGIGEQYDSQPPASAIRNPTPSPNAPIRLPAFHTRLRHDFF